MCPLTGEKANYIDPDTLIPYANYEAFQTIKQIKRHEFIWSPIIHGYIHAHDTIVDSAPEWFIPSTRGANEEEWEEYQAKNKEKERIDALMKEQNLQKVIKEAEMAQSLVKEEEEEEGIHLKTTIDEKIKIHQVTEEIQYKSN